MAPSHQSRLIALSIFCVATLNLNLSSVDAFSLVQNAAPSQQPRDSDGNGTASGGARASASASASASAASKNNNNNNPFRGTPLSLNSRRPRPSSRGAPSPGDFALRMGVQSDMELEHDHESVNIDGTTESQHHQHQQSDAMPLNSHHHHAPSALCSSSDCQTEMTSSDDDENAIYERRVFLSGMLATTAAAVSAISPATIIEPASAYEQAYPVELQSTAFNGEKETSANSLSKLKEERLSNKKAKVAATKSELKNDPLGLNPQSLLSNNNFGLTIAGASTWALALWLATGSRSNPIVTPLANVLYDDKSEDWLADRNDGYFGDLPLSFTAILSAVFVFLGVVLDRAVYFLADGDAEVSLELAGVSVIGGALWEVGRLAAKEKAPTREEYERDVVLYREFEEFANRRLVVGRGSCHRSDVISAFRRFNPKYRTADNEQYPLGDIEIERILRVWNREFGSRSEMSSAGFFSGISVDDVADAFAPR